jgi:hypothetical protein
MSNITAKIVQDFDPLNPRTEYDNLGTMACWHSRYTLGDVQPSEDPDEYLADLPEGSIILPLYLYDHSGLTMSTSAFGCPWDSGQVGVIYVTPERLRAEYGDDSADTRIMAAKVLVAEVKVYDQYLTGDVWGFEVTETEDCECCGAPKELESDSCFGFWGGEHCLADMKEHVDSKFHAALDAAWAAL